MANQTITQLPAAGPITGTELVPIVQNGQTVRTTTQAISASPSQTQTFLTVQNEPTLVNSRFLAVGTGLGLTDGGAQSNLQIALNGASASLETAGNGFMVKTGFTTLTPRSVAVSGAGIAITNGDGQSGDPTIALSGLPLSLANAAGPGIVALTGLGTVIPRSITGTASEIDVANGDGASNAPTIGLADNPVLPGTAGVTLPTGNTAARPALPANGLLRYNSQTTRFEGYQGGNWTNFGTGDGTVQVVTGTANQITVVDGALNPIISITDNPIIPGTSAIRVPAGNTSERTGSPLNGMLRYNTQTATFEGYANNAWGAIVTGTGVTSVNVTGGTTGLTTTGGPITSAGTIVFGGTLITANGGTGLSSFTAGDTLYYTSGDALSKLAIGASTYIMTSNGTAPTWTDPNSITVSTATNLAGGAAGSIPYQTSAGVTTFLATGTGLLSNNGGNPTYTVTPSGLTSVTVTQNPTAALQLATKQYVDDAVSSGIDIHPPVRVESPTALNATYTPGGTSITVTDIAGGTTLTLSTSPSLAVNDQIVFSSTANGIVAGTAYYVFSTPAANQITLSLSYNGPEITTFTNGTGLTIGGLVNAGVGATLTNAGANAAIQIDGISLSVTNRVLVYNQANAAHNGVYTVTTVGDGSTPWVLTRAVTENTYKPDSTTGLGQGDYFFVQEGLTGAGESYVLTTNNPLIIGTTNLTFTQFSASQVYSAGTGLTLTGTQFSITNTGVSAATYGSASQVPAIAVNAQGQITSATNTSIAINANQVTSGTLDVARGGTGSGSTPTNGQLLIGNGTGFTLAGLTAGTGISITNGSGSVTINSSAASIDDVIALAIALG